MAIHLYGTIKVICFYLFPHLYDAFLYTLFHFISFYSTTNPVNRLIQTYIFPSSSSLRLIYNFSFPFPRLGRKHISITVKCGWLAVEEIRSGRVVGIRLMGSEDFVDSLLWTLLFGSLLGCGGWKGQPLGLDHHGGVYMNIDIHLSGG